MNFSQISIVKETWKVESLRVNNIRFGIIGRKPKIKKAVAKILGNLKAMKNEFTIQKKQKLLLTIRQN